MNFQASQYGPAIARLLETNGGGHRLVPLVCERTAPDPALLKLTPNDLFPNATHPRAALAGLLLYLSCFDAAHDLADSIEDPDGYFWHAIVHRQEPDSWKSGYWFGKVGRHPIFPSLAREAAAIAPQFNAPEWDPYAFIKYCEQARGTSDDETARKIQRAEWQLLFDHCARPAATSKGASN